MPAPVGNQNRTVHGVRGYLALGSLPRGARYIRRLIGELRTALESAVSEANGGEISIYHGALIQSACRHEGRALLLSRYLRIEPDLALAERLAILKEIGTASDSRDKCLKAFGLDAVKSSDPWAIAMNAIHSAPITTNGESASASPPASHTRDGDGFNDSADQKP
jgi:hypothetical protein